MVEGVCLLAILIGRLCRRGTGLVGILNEVPAAAEYEFGPPAVQCDSQAPIASNGRLGARSHLKNSHGRKHLRFVSSPGCCLGAQKHREEALSSTSPPHQKSRRSSWFARAPSRSQFGDSSLREHRLALMHGRLGRNANPRHTVLRSSESGRFFVFPFSTLHSQTNCSRAKLVQHCHELWYGRSTKKCITSDIRLYRNIHSC